MSELRRNSSDAHFAHSPQYIIEVKLGELRSNACGAHSAHSPRHIALRIVVRVS